MDIVKRHFSFFLLFWLENYTVCQIALYKNISHLYYSLFHSEFPPISINFSATSCEDNVILLHVSSFDFSVEENNTHQKHLDCCCPSITFCEMSVLHMLVPFSKLNPQVVNIAANFFLPNPSLHIITYAWLVHVQCSHCAISIYCQWLVCIIQLFDMGV